MLKYCQNCYAKPRKLAITVLDFKAVCVECAIEIRKQIAEQNKDKLREPRSKGLKQYLRHMGVREEIINQ